MRGFEEKSARNGQVEAEVGVELVFFMGLSCLYLGGCISSNYSSSSSCESSYIGGHQSMIEFSFGVLTTPSHVL